MSDFGIEWIYIVAPEWEKTLPWTCLKSWYFGFSETHYLDLWNQKDNFENAVRNNDQKTISTILKTTRKEKGGLNFSDLCKVWWYGDNVKVTAIVGENGSGKSQLMDLLLQIIEISKKSNSWIFYIKWSLNSEIKAYIFIKYSEHTFFPILERENYPKTIDETKRKHWYILHSNLNEFDLWNTARMVTWDDLIEKNKEEERIIRTLNKWLSRKSNTFMSFISSIFPKIWKIMNGHFEIEFFQNYDLEKYDMYEDFNYDNPEDLYNDHNYKLYFRIVYFRCFLYAKLSQNKILQKCLMIDHDWKNKLDYLHEISQLWVEFINILKKNKTPLNIDHVRWIFYNALKYFLIWSDNHLEDGDIQFVKLQKTCQAIILLEFSRHEFSKFQYSQEQFNQDIQWIHSWDLSITFGQKYKKWHNKIAFNEIAQQKNSSNIAVSRSRDELFEKLFHKNLNWLWSNWFKIKIPLDLLSSNFIEKLFTFKSFDRDYFDFISVNLNNISIKNWEEYKIFQASSGEVSLLKRFMRNILYEILQNNQKQSYIICIDEPDLFLHIRRQKKYIKWFIWVLCEISHKKFHFILATHSPFIVSDIPENNLLILKEWEDKTEEYVDYKNQWKDKKNSFANTAYWVVSQFMWMWKDEWTLWEFTKTILEIFVKEHKKLLSELWKLEEHKKIDQEKIKAKKDKIEENYKKYEKVIEGVGDEFLQQNLLHLIWWYAKIE